MSMILAASPKCSVSGSDIGVQAAEQEAAIGFEARDLGQVVRAILVEGFRISGAARVLHREQLAGVVERPAVERAGIAGLVGPLVAAQHRAAMAARVDEGVQLAVPVAGDEDRLPAHGRREVVVVVRDLALMRQVDPVALEDVLHLEFEDLRIGEDIARDAEGAARRIIHQGGVERRLDRYRAFVFSFAPSFAYGSTLEVASSDDARHHSFPAGRSKTKLVGNNTWEV